MDAGGKECLKDFLAALEISSQDLEDRLVTLRLAINETRSLLERDLPLSQVLTHSRCPAARGAAEAAAEEFIDLLHDYRAETVRQLVDEEGWSLTEVAKHTGNARQVVARLYHSALDGPASGRSRPQPKVRLAHPQPD